MAHGRKRSCLGGMLLGIVIVIAAGILILLASDITMVEPGRPLFMNNAKETAGEWARLPGFPPEAKSFEIITGGTMFTRSFRVTFFGDPADIDAWVKSCPGVSDPKCEKEELAGGGIRYRYPAGGGAMHAELIHFPTRGTVEVYTYWS
jgi:hypothetical protein